MVDFQNAVKVASNLFDDAAPASIPVQDTGAAAPNPSTNGQVKQDDAPASTDIDPAKIIAKPDVTPPAPIVEDYSEFGVKSKDELKAKWEELNTKAKELESDDEYTRKWRTARSQGISKEIFDSAFGIDLKKMSPEEKVGLAKQLKDNLSVEDAEFIVSNEFKLGKKYDPESEDPELNDPALRVAKINFDKAVKEAEVYLKEYQEESLTPPAVKVAKEWGDTVKSVLQEASDISVTLDGIGEISYSAKGRPDIQKKLKETVDAVMSHPNFKFKPDEEGKKFLADVIQRELFSMQKQEIINHFVKEQSAIAKAKELEKNVNPSVLNLGLPVPKSVLTDDQKLVAAMKGRM